MSAHQRAQLLRVGRLIAFALLAQPAAAALVSSTLARYPIAGALIAVAEALVRQAFPVKPLPPRISPMPAPPSGPSTPTGA